MFHGGIMLKIIYSLMFFMQVDPRIIQLQKDIEFYKFMLSAAGVVILILFIVIFLFWFSLKKRLGPQEKGVMKSVLRKSGPPAKPAAEAVKTVPQTAVKSRDLPDPGLVYKFSLADEKVTEKLITIGQTEGNIRTYSTEVMNDHFEINIRIIDNQRDRDIYNLPEKIFEEYILDMKRDGRVLIYYPGLEGWRQMGARERIYIKQEPDVAGDPTFPVIEAKQPVRLRLGDRLNQDEKFAAGYFEFHLFTQDYEVKTSAGIPKVEKNFMLRLYKIYPGYDMASPSPEGLYPMSDPFRAG